MIKDSKNSPIQKDVKIANGSSSGCWCVEMNNYTSLW